MADADAVLQHLRSLLGAGGPPVWPQRTFGAPVAGVPDWTGDLSTTAHDASTRLDDKRAQLATTYASAGPLVSQAAAIGENARRRMDSVIAQWHADKAALAPYMNTGPGRHAYIYKAQERITDAKHVLTDAVHGYEDLARQLTTAAEGLPSSDANAKTATQPEKFDWAPDGKEWTFIGAGAVVDGTTDAIRKAAVTAMKEGATSGPGKASPGLVKFLDDVKIAGKTIKGVSGAGGVMSAVMVIPNVLADRGEGDSWRKAFGKNAGGAAAGVGAGAAAGAIAGTFIPIPPGCRDGGWSLGRSVFRLPRDRGSRHVLGALGGWGG
jgi:hypothetical protein